MINDSDSPQETQYMLERTAALVMTDLRSVKQLGDAWVGIRALDKDSLFIPYVPLLLSLNILRLWSRFQVTVIAPLLRIAGPKSSDARFVDWDSTFKSIHQGESLVSYRSRECRPRSGTKEKQVLVGMVLEISSHLRLLMEALKEPNGAGRTNKLVVQMKAMYDDLEMLIKKTTVCNQMDDMRDELAALEGMFRSIVNGKAEESPRALEAYVEYHPTYLNTTGLDLSVLKESLAWRYAYLNLSTGLGPGRELLVRGSTDIPHLFEMWCFYEVINQMKREGVHTIQRSKISGRWDLEVFNIQNIGRVYYNYHGVKRNEDQRLSKILKGSCVEWYILLTNGSSIVFDTKYKKWSSADTLTVLGYMADFGARMGVVVFGKDFPLNSYATTRAQVVEDSFILTEVPNGYFCGMRLVPRPDWQKRNEQVIRLFVAQIAEMVN